MSVVKKLSLLYTRCLVSQPCLTKALTTAVLNTVEEYSAQRLSCQHGSHAPINTTRIMKMALYGLLLSGPLSHHLYRMLEEMLGHHVGTAAAILKILASNFVLAPIQNLVYVVALGVISRFSADEMDAHVRSTFWPIMKQTWLVFPLVSAVAQYFVPPQLHTPFYSLTALVFGVYCNLMSRSQKWMETVRT